MTRFSIIERADMNDEQGELFDNVKAEGGPLGGPYWAYIHHPKLMRLAQDTSNYLRTGDLSPRERQIAILTVIRHWGAHYPWAVQVRGSLNAGVDQEIVDTINNGQAPDLLDVREKAAYDVATELMANHGMSDETYANAEGLFGLETLIGLVATIGQFSMTCNTTNAFDITPPDDVPHRLV